MAINPINGKNNSLVHKINTNLDKPSKTGSNSAETAVDKTDYSSIAHEIKKALTSTAAVPIIDSDKVAAIKTALQNGDYQINADSIAEKILQFDHQLRN